jgi:hypothetical protein
MTHWRLIAISVFGVLSCTATTPALSNGDTFFQSTEIAGNPHYVIFGCVKDVQGHYLTHATVKVHVAEHMFDVSAQTNVLGRFRTPDVGREINDLGYEVDPALITISVEYPGYHIAHREYRGKYRQNRGAIEINFLMEKNSVG